MEHPGLEEDTLHDANVEMSRKYEGGGSRFASGICACPGDARASSSSSSKSSSPSTSSRSSPNSSPCCNWPFCLANEISISLSESPSAGSGERSSCC